MKETRICPICGKPLPDIRCGRKTHAGFCTRVQRANYMREYMREYYGRKKAQEEAQASPPEDAAPARLTLDEFAAKARSEGKTYGQLRAEMLLERMKGEKR